MDNEAQITRIENYLNDRMTADEKVMFENELAGDPQLLQLFKEHKYFIDGIEGMKAEEFVQKLRNPSVSPGRETLTMLKWRYISIAAIILFLVGMYFIFSATKMQRLAREYYSAPLAQLQRSSVPADDSTFETGMRAYADGEWQIAISNFTKIKEDHPLFQTSQYYMAHSYSALKKFEIALEIFQRQVLSQGQYQQPSEWSAALMKMFLRYPQDEVIRDLTMIANQSGHYYNEKARMLIDKLEGKESQ